MQYFTIFQDKLHSFNIQDHSKHTWAFNETIQKNFQNQLLYGQPVLTFDKRQICSEH